jgi:hypothetical protein
MRQAKHPLVAACAVTLATVLFGSGGCGAGDGSHFGAADAGSPFGGGGFGQAGFDGSLTSTGLGVTPQCGASTGWQCAVDTSCPSSSPTTLKGKVYDPGGLNPLYDVVVFIPKVVSSLPQITPGTHSCNTCDVAIGNYVVATTTDGTGSFTLPGVPTGMNVPVTVQIGKWRRTVGVDIPTSCSTNTVTDGALRLPAKQSEGDMPQMAVLTGGCDDLGCFMKGMGIDPSEFTAPHAGGRLDVYQGVGMGGGGGGFGGGGGGGGGGQAATLSNGTAGNCTNASCPLWASKQSFESYDIVLLSCECAENRQTKPASAQQALHDWLDEGGRVFASHYHYTWFRDSPAADFQGVARWGNTGNNDTAIGGGHPYDVDTSFPKGATFGQWLGTVKGLNSAGPPPNIVLNQVADSVVAVNAPTTRWIYDSQGAPDVKYLSFGTPIGGAPPPPDAGEQGVQYCGKAVFTDLHTGGSLLSTVGSIPAGCTNKGLSDQQKALEFLFFDLSACVTNDMVAPPPLPPPTQ